MLQHITALQIYVMVYATVIAKIWSHFARGDFFAGAKELKQKHTRPLAKCDPFCSPCFVPFAV